jgi:BirA family biotin operon repressor/biotin-[acetyl-CoA-carboxylase] ligase
MSGAPRPIDRRRLEEQLRGSDFVRRLVVVERTASTHEDARRLAAEGAPSGTVVVADAQSAGQGRRGRSWFSPSGLGVYLSVVIRPSGRSPVLTHWTLAASLAACEACIDGTGASVGIEWPNDLVHGGRKLAGILTSARSAGRAAEELVVGTGFNVNHTERDFPPELAPRATSLRIALGGSVVDRERLAALYLRRLATCAQALENGGAGELLEHWARRAPRASGARVEVRPEGQPSFDGTTRGIDPAGALRVQRDDGAVIAVHWGEAVSYLEGR